MIERAWECSLSRDSQSWIIWECNGDISSDGGEIGEGVRVNVPIFLNTNDWFWKS